MKTHVISRSPIMALLMSFFAITIFQIAYVVAPISPSPASMVLSMMAPSLAVVFWVDADARSRRCVPCYDFGILIALFFPVSLFWYALWSRGGWGLLSAIALTGLMYVPSFSAIAVWNLLNGAN